MNQLVVPNISDYKIEYYFADSFSEQTPRNWEPHIHDRLELYVLVEGDVSFAVDSSHYKLSPGDAIITKPNEIHNCILNSRSVHRHLCFWFDISSNFIFDDFLNHDYGSYNHLRPSEDDKKRLMELYTALTNANREGNKLTEFYLSLEMLAIFK